MNAHIIKHTDSVEATTREAVFIHQAFQRAKPHNYHKPFEETDQEYQRVMQSIASELIVRNQQQVEEVVRKERERIKNIILRRTEIPKGARNPTRDAVVLLGEELVELVTHDVTSRDA